MAEKLTTVGEFKIEMPCIRLRLASGSTMRALVLATAELEPPNPLYIVAGLFLENGNAVKKVIPRADFIAGQRTPVTLVEAKDMKGAPLLYVPDSSLTGG